MRLEVIRQVTDWLKQEGPGGYNDMLERIELDLVTDSRPGRMQFIGDNTRDFEVQRFLDPPRTPALYVHLSAGGLIEIEGETHTNDHRDTVPGGGVQLDFRYFDQQGGKDECAPIQRCDYAMRALVRSLKRFLDHAGPGAEIRNGIEIVGCERMAYGPWVEKAGTAQTAAGCTALFVVRDNNP